MKRPPRQKRHRGRVERFVHIDRVYPARLMRVHPQPGRREIVEVHVSRTRRQMRDTTARFGERRCKLVQGCVLHYFSTITNPRRSVMRDGRVVARMFLNVRDLRAAPGEIVSHESGHAAMAWARLRGADLKDMQGEEVLCYAIGHLTQQITNRLWGAGGSCT